MNSKNIEWTPLKFKFPYQNFFLIYDQLKIEEDSIQLVLQAKSRDNGSIIGYCCFDFLDSIYSYRVTRSNPLSIFEEIIISSHKNCEAFTPLYCYNSYYLNWIHEEFNARNLIHLLIYDEDFYYEFIVDELPEVYLTECT